MFFASAQALASGGEDTAGPWELDIFGGGTADQRAYYEGNLGVLMSQAPWSRLFAGWRMLHGQKVGYDVGQTLAAPCCGANIFNAYEEVPKVWVEARAAFDPDTKPGYIDIYRQLADYSNLQTCFADAFRTAAKTLNDRIAAYGKDSPWVKAWVEGQDAVFQSCSKEASLPDLPAGAPDWLVKDHAYQAAAMMLYRFEFQGAAAAFNDIARDTASPWHEIAPYLALRANIRYAITNPSANWYETAHQGLAPLNGVSAKGFTAEDVSKLANALAFREEPDKRREQLIQELTAATLKPTAAADFKDLRRLGQKPPNTPELLDWLATFGRAEGYQRNKEDEVWKNADEALAHARERWTASKDPAWLLAVLQGTNQGDPAAAELIDQAAHVAKDHPAYLTAFYHRVRLMIPVAPAAQLRSELDGVLGRQDLLTTTRNLFLAERDEVAETLADFETFAPRVTQPCSVASVPGGDVCLAQLFMQDVGGGGDPAAAWGIGTNAVSIIDKMSLDMRAELAERRHLPHGAQYDLAFSTWVRAVLLENDAVSDRLARVVIALKPEMKGDLESFLNAKNKPDKRFAAYFLLAKTRNASVDMTEQYYWQNWLFIPTGKAPPETLPTPVQDFSSPDKICSGSCGQGSFALRLPDFVTKAQAAADEQRRRYLPVGAMGARGQDFKEPPDAGSVWEEVLSYVQAHPADSRSPEALYWLVKVSRFGTGHNQSSKRAFLLLHKRYPDTHWAKETKYFYD